MDNNLIHKPSNLPSLMSGGFWHVFKIVSLSVLAFLLIFGTGAYVWAQGFNDRVPPNVSVAGVDYSSLT
ncbi:MAG: hypothetical protein P8J32_08425, partial [bacterium]|nr:hypothetical protein [bacterium]